VLRRDRPEVDTLVTALGRAYTRGVDLDWRVFFDGTGAKWADLPTYAFQRERYWVDVMLGVDEISAAGLGSADHPMLGAAVELPDSTALLFTGRLSVQTHPWLEDHIVGDAVVVPGSAFVELAVSAGTRVDCPHLAELTLEEPLVLPERGGVRLRMSVGEPDSAGRRTLAVHTRPESPAGEDERWVRHASGVLAGVTAVPEPARPAVWPPAGAEPVAVGDVHGGLAAAGILPGPAFQGLERIWRRGDEIYADVRLADSQQAEAARYLAHPALLAAATQPAALADGGSFGRMPVSWHGVTVHAVGASAVRVRLAPAAGPGISVHVTDQTGAPVATIDTLTLGEVDLTRVAPPAAGVRDAVFRLEWETVAVPEATYDGVAVVGRDEWKLAAHLETAGVRAAAYDSLDSLSAAVAAGLPAPGLVLVPFVPDSSGELVEDVHRATRAALRTLQEWLGGGRPGTARMVAVTRGAVAAPGGGDVADLVHAPVWGLLRAAQAENPDQFVLLDLDGEASVPALPGAVATGEPELALRAGRAYVPRLMRAAARDAVPGEPDLDPRGTVLITGATGGLGRLLARHLVTGHGARRLLLASRQGPAGSGIAELTRDLRALGADVTVTACDTADRDAVAALLAGVPAEHPLTAVVHVAGVLDDGVIDLMTPDRLDRVLRPKVDAAWHLHELTRDLNLSAFVLFSAAAGTLGSPGQGSYSAANVFLDALARHRRAQGLAGVSLVWGMWAEEGGMAGRLGAADRERVARGGVLPLSAADGLALFDAAVSETEPVPVLARLNLAALRASAAAGTLLPLLHRLVRTPVRRAAEPAGPAGAPATAESRADQLAGLSEAARQRTVLELVRREVAAVLGYASKDLVGAEQAFTELGFDSLTAVELRNRLNTSTGLRLPATLVYDYPKPSVLARHLQTAVAPEPVTTGPSVLDELERLENALSSLSPEGLAAVAEDEAADSRIAVRLQSLLTKWNEIRRTAEPGAGTLDDASDDELFDFIDKRFGKG